MAPKWFWAGDTDGNPGAQDKPTEFSPAVTAILENARAANEKKVSVDKERFVQLNRKNMYQARIDAPDRRRAVWIESDSSDEGVLCARAVISTILTLGMDAQMTPQMLVQRHPALPLP